MPVTVRDALTMEPLRRARLVAGGDGLDREITSVNVMEVPDIINWVRPGALLLTTAYPIKDDPGAQARLVPELAGKGLAGLGLKPARYLPHIPEAMINAANQYSFPLIELPPDVSFNDILHPLLSEILNRQAYLLKRSEETHKRFTAVALAGGGLSEIAVTLAEIVGAPVTVADSSFRVLACAIPGGVAGLTKGDFERSLALFRENNGVRGLPNSLFRKETLLGGMVVVQVVQPIRSSGSVYGYLSAWEVERPLKEEDLVAIEHAATVSALAMMKEQAVAEIEKRFRNEFLDRLLTGDYESLDAVVARGRIFGWDLTRSYAVLLVAVDGLDEAYLKGLEHGELRTRKLGTSVLQIVESVIHSGRHDAIVVDKGGRVVILYHPDSTESCVAATKRLAESILRAARLLLSDATVSVGVGRLYPDVSQLRFSYREARRAIDVASRILGGNCAMHFEDLGAYRLLARFSDRGELNAFYQDTVGRLVAYDEDNGSDLVRTLEVFLSCNGNAQQTAEKLYVHYNTLRYRVRRIEEILGVDLGSAEVRFNLQLGLKVKRLLSY